jgi:hypothetical protein
MRRSSRTTPLSERQRETFVVIETSDPLVCDVRKFLRRFR